MTDFPNDVQGLLREISNEYGEDEHWNSNPCDTRPAFNPRGLTLHDSRQHPSPIYDLQYRPRVLLDNDHGYIQRSSELDRYGE